MKKYGIIFDCDGTLVDSLGQALESFNYALDKVGLPPRPIETVKRHFGAGADRIFFKILGNEEKSREAFEHYLEHQTELAKITRLHPGISELLDTLSAAGVPLGIVTGRHSKDLEIVLRPHGLHERFATLVTDDLLSKSKPAPDGILLAAERMELPIASTFYVGDSTVDIQAARSAGSVAVAALWDRHARHDEMLGEKPELMATMPQQVWEFFRSKFMTK